MDEHSEYIAKILAHYPDWQEWERHYQQLKSLWRAQGSYRWLDEIASHPNGFVVWFTTATRQILSRG
jgi:hypothetical protein